MSNEHRLSFALADVAKDYSNLVADVIKYDKQLSALEAGGFVVNATQWTVRCRSSLDIARSSLPQLRSIVGRLQVSGKHVPGDFNSSHELEITVRPMSKDFDSLCFSYRSPFRGGGKCHVEMQTSTYQTIVCKV